MKIKIRLLAVNKKAITKSLRYNNSVDSDELYLGRQHERLLKNIS